MSNFFDFNNLTLDEVEMIENLTSSSIDSIMDEGKPKGRVAKVLMFIAEKRANPNVTLEDIGKKTLTDFTVFMESVADPKA